MGDRREDEIKVYVGGLPQDATSEEIENIFSKYGRLRKVWIARRPPGFAFVHFEDVRDAEDAVKALDGSKICGNRARVEMSNGRRRNDRNDRGGGGFRNDSRGGGGGYRDRGGYRGGDGGDRGGARGRSRSRSPRRYSRSPSRSPRRSGSP